MRALLLSKSEGEFTSSRIKEIKALHAIDGMQRLNFIHLAISSSRIFFILSSSRKNPENAMDPSFPITI